MTMPPNQTLEPTGMSALDLPSRRRVFVHHRLPVAQLFRYVKMRALGSLVLLAFIALSLGCGSQPTPKQIVGRWESNVVGYTLDFHTDGTYTKTASASSPSLSGSAVPYSMVAPSGRWELRGSDLIVRDGSEAGASIMFRVISSSPSGLVLRFGDGGLVQFVKK